MELLGEEPSADRTEVANLPRGGRYERTQVEPRAVSQETPQVDDGGWGSAPDTISTVDDAARMGVLRPIRPESNDGDIDENAPGRTRPMRPKGSKGSGSEPKPKGKGFMPVRVESGKTEPPRQESPPRPLVDRPLATPAPPARQHRSPTMVVLLDTLRRRKRFLWRVSFAALVVAVGAAIGIQRMEQARRDADVQSLFSGPDPDAGAAAPTPDPVRPPLPKEIAAMPEYATPGPDGAAFLTVLAGTSPPGC